MRLPEYCARRAYARALEADVDTSRLQLIRVRQGTRGVNDRVTAERWAAQQPWAGRIVSSRYERGWWCWRVGPRERWGG